MTSCINLVLAGCHDVMCDDVVVFWNQHYRLLALCKDDIERLRTATMRLLKIYFFLSSEK